MNDLRFLLLFHFRYVWIGTIADTLHKRLFDRSNTGRDPPQSDAFGQIDLDQQSNRNAYACRRLRDAFQCLNARMPRLMFANISI